MCTVLVTRCIYIFAARDTAGQMRAYRYIRHSIQHTHHFVLRFIITAPVPNCGVSDCAISSIYIYIQNRESDGNERISLLMLSLSHTLSIYLSLSLDLFGFDIDAPIPRP